MVSNNHRRKQKCDLSVLDQKYPFLGKFGAKSQNYQFKLEFVTSTNSNMQNSVVMFTFSVLSWKYPFWVKLVQKVKIFSLSSKIGT